MSVPIIVLTALAGGLGAALRLLIDGAVKARWGTLLPWGTWVINLTGSLALGLATGLLGGRAGAADLVWVLGTGFLGGYTTFSTACVESVRLGQAGRREAAAVNAVGMLVAGVASAWLGVRLGVWLAGG